MKSLFEEMGGTYTLGADGMYYPDLELPEEEPHYGKYGRMRLRYLKEHHKMLYMARLDPCRRRFNLGCRVPDSDGQPASSSTPWRDKARGTFFLLEANHLIGIRCHSS